MTTVRPNNHDLATPGERQQARHALAHARRDYYEHPAEALEQAIRCEAIGRSLGDRALRARARALQGAVSLHRGDLRGALRLAVEAERHARVAADRAADVEVAALKAQLGFFTGSYAEALSEAEAAVRMADEARDIELRIFARRSTCIVFGNVGVPDLEARLAEVVDLTVAAGSRWEEAISRNDIACHLQAQGDLLAAEHEIDRAHEVARAITTGNSLALAVIHSTRADIRLLAGRPDEALEDAERAIALLTAGGEPNPYILAVTVRAHVHALMALGKLDDAQRSGEGALGWLGDRVPQTRSLILSTVAEALRAAGRLEEAYDALARAAELERQAFRELSELQIGLERATLEAHAARSQSHALAAKNRELADAHAELQDRADELEALQSKLQDQADRDWLTGLHNRRYLAGELERLASDRRARPFSLAVMDLDLFKSINDDFGHAVGDRVLVRAAALICDAVRASDVVIRSGGEEFLVLMPRTDESAAASCCERIRTAIRSDDWTRIAGGLSVTASVGVASTAQADELEELMKLADDRLYDAKRGGRDQVVGAA